MLATLPGCFFKKQPSNGVMSYRHGQVYLQSYRSGKGSLQRGDVYSVGILPEGWKRLATRVRTISFYNKEYRSSISTDAICDRQTSNRALTSLAGDLVSALEGRTRVGEEEFMLDGRGALRQHVEGKIDGVPTAVDIVVVRKGECVFDFYLVAPLTEQASATGDFEQFFGAFHYE
jgi:hypothetical protein